MPPKPGARRPKATTARTTRAKESRETPVAMETADVEIIVEEMHQFSESKNIAIYGPSGVGKTVLAAGCPRATFLTTEKGLSSARAAGSQARIMRAFDWDHVVAAKKKADEMLTEDDWLIVDSGTKMQVLHQRWVLLNDKKANPSRSLDVPAIHNYQQFYNEYKRFVDSVIDAPYNSIFCFGEMEVPGEDDELERVPHIEGGKMYQVMRYIIGQFDVGIRLTVSDELSTPDHTVRYAQIQPDANHWAKDRYMALGDFQTIEPYDFTAMERWIETIEAAEKEDSENAA